MIASVKVCRQTYRQMDRQTDLNWGNKNIHAKVSIKTYLSSRATIPIARELTTDKMRLKMDENGYGWR